MGERLFLSTEEVAKRIGLCEKSVRRGIKRGDLPGYRVGKRFVIPTEVFDAFMRGEWVPSARAAETEAPKMIHQRALDAAKNSGGAS